MDFTQFSSLLLAGLYILITGIFILFGVFTVYILIRYGASRSVSLLTSLAFIIFFLVTLSLSFTSLQAIHF